MVHVPPPSPAGTSSNSLNYATAYEGIRERYRKSLLTAASSVVILVAPDVDALCAARMIADLFNQDGVQYSIKPVSGILELERVRDELLHTLILLNMGGILDLPSAEWFGDFGPQLNVHVIDSTRPFNLSSLFGSSGIGDRILVWDDGEADRLVEEHRAWEFITYEPEVDSDEESEFGSDREDDNEEEADGFEQDANRSTKRRHAGDGEGNSPKRRRFDDEVRRRVSREERDSYAIRLNKYYGGGTWHGQSASATIYILANALNMVDNDLLWLAIVGLTHHYTTSRASREKYEQYQAMYNDEVARLNPPLENEPQHSLISLSPDDASIRPVEELRFMHFRHWTLYDAMYHSSYVASKLGLWKERGRKRLTGLLAKMGFSIPQTQQPYHHMDLDLKKDLYQKLTDTAPEYGLVELVYPSFIRCFGYKTQPLSAADTVDGLSALLEVATGIQMEIEIEGARNGGEWFGAGRLWETANSEKESRNGSKASEQVYGNHNSGRSGHDDPNKPEDDPDDKAQPDIEAWWVQNFWTAYDALTNIAVLRDSLSLSMSLHRAIIRQGTSIIDKQSIRTTRTHRVVIITQGPDLALFSHPAVLSRLALWLVDALRDRVPASNLNSKKKSLPFVVACLDEVKKSFIVVGVIGALEFGDVRKNAFSAAFIHAQARCNAEVKHVSFDTNVVQIDQAELPMFLDALCEGPDQ
ncbi:CDC45-like protein [Pluteus cervinus]|uniref:CDC45-like protein n=1 Tax=Pluteus cervinus TaxID=181527 RepID=A0ACD3BFB7_9AGAR|nr:CDC45-like protein [Pluteus cervinus]